MFHQIVISIDEIRNGRMDISPLYVGVIFTMVIYLHHLVYLDRYRLFVEAKIYISSYEQVKDELPFSGRACLSNSLYTECKFGI